MSGHSKWHQIRYKKGIMDKRRGQLFSKVARLIEVAARQGADPETNFKLRLAIEKAREINLPKENISRAIKKGSGEIKGAGLEEIIFEGYGPFGIALMIEVLTDNRNRATSEIRNILTKFGGKVSGSGSVSWMFEKRGVIRIETSDMRPALPPALSAGRSGRQKTREDLELKAIDAGALDFKEEKDLIEIYTKPEELHKVKKDLEKEVSISSWEILQIPKNIVKIEGEEAARKILRLMETLEDSEEVQNVHSNFDIPDEIMTKATL